MDIVNGYVYIPVGAAEMLDTITLKFYNGTAATADAALQIAPMYYLAKATSTNTAKAALLDAIANYAMTASLMKGNREGVTSIPHATLAQMHLSDDGGMAYIIQMTDGRFILVDGGVSVDQNVNVIWKYMLEKNNYARPVIACWMFTHQDGDHTNAAVKILTEYASKIELQSMAYTWPVEADFTILDTDTDYVKGYKESTLEQIKSKTATFKAFETRYADTEIIPLPTGASFTIGEVQIDVLLDHNDKYPTNPMEANDLSSAWKMTFTQNTESTADDKSFMVLGDCTQPRTAALLDLYEDSGILKSDVLQAAHHGLYGGYLETYIAINPDITLVPTYEARWNEWKVSQDYNKWLDANSDCYHASQNTVVDMYDLSVSFWS